jgi:hypothetical protein
VVNTLAACFDCTKKPVENYFNLDIPELLFGLILKLKKSIPVWKFVTGWDYHF